jgi:hypothetical protein
LPDEIGGDPSDTLLWDTQQLEALRAKWTGSSGLSEPAAEAPQAEEHPPTDKDEAEKTADRRQAEGGVQGGYRPAFEPYVVDSSALPNPEEAAKERKAKLQAARRRATIQLIFGIALNLVLFLIALKLALPFIQKLMASSAPAQQTGPREIGQPEQPAAGPNDRPVPIPREGETPSEPADAKPESAPAKASKLEAPPEPAKPAPVPVKEVEIPSPTPKSESAPPEDKPVEAKSSSKPKPPVAAKEESQPPEKDPMKSDLMKDEIPSYYGDPNWAKKGKRTVRIVIPDWHKKKDETSDAETKEPEKAKPTKPQAPPDAEEPQ